MVTVVKYQQSLQNEGGPVPELPPPRSDGSLYFDQLTRRQQVVVRYVFQGLTNREIGVAMNVSIKTVEKHRKLAMEKMSVSCVVDLIRLLCRELGPESERLLCDATRAARRDATGTTDEAGVDAANSGSTAGGSVPRSRPSAD